MYGVAFNLSCLKYNILTLKVILNSSIYNTVHWLHTIIFQEINTSQTPCLRLHNIQSMFTDEQYLSYPRKLWLCLISTHHYRSKRTNPQLFCTHHSQHHMGSVHTHQLWEGKRQKWQNMVGNVQCSLLISKPNLLEM